jgi:hypothetical protein
MNLARTPKKLHGQQIYVPIGADIRIITIESSINFLDCSHIDFEMFLRNGGIHL